MDLNSLLKQFEMRSMMAITQSLPPMLHISNFPRFKRLWPFPRARGLFAIYESTERVLMWPSDSWGACRRALGWEFLRHIWWWVDEILSPSQHSSGLVRTWHGWPRIPTRLDNRNIQKFLSLKLNSFVFYITTFFFSIRRILSYDLSFSVSLLLMRWR